MSTNQTSIRLFLTILLFSNIALAAEGELTVQVVPIGGIGSTYVNSSSSSTASILTAPLILFGGLGGLIQGAIMGSQTEKPATPEDDIKNNKLTAMLIKNNSQLFFSNRLADELKDCKVNAIVSSSPVSDQSSPIELEKKLESISKGAVLPAPNSSYVVEAGELTFSLQTQTFQDFLFNTAYARVYKVPKYELVKKYKTKNTEHEYVTDFKESSVENLGKLKEASELVMTKNAKSIAKQICDDKSSGLIN